SPAPSSATRWPVPEVEPEVATSAATPAGAVDAGAGGASGSVTRSAGPVPSSACGRAASTAVTAGTPVPPGSTVAGRPSWDLMPPGYDPARVPWSCPHPDREDHMAGRRRRLAVLTIAALALTGCASSAPREAGTPSTAPTTVAPTPAAVPTWPLTGVPVDDAEARPAVAVKVENTAMARPQTGLEEADVVWEEMVEGGITRFNAVFHSRLPEVVGPIRSVRPMDAGIAAPLGGPQVISGGQPLFLGSVQDAGVQLISHDAGHAGFFRSPDRRAPHNLYGRLAELLSQAEATEPPRAQFTFAVGSEEASAVLDGEPASALRLSFPQTSPGWTWDADA